MPPTKKSPLIYVIPIAMILVIIIVAVVILMSRGSNTSQTTADSTQSGQGGFAPFGRIPTNNTASTTGSTAQNNDSSYQDSVPSKPATLRLLSNDPVGGYGASTTASTTVVRWVGRGRGNVYEAHEDNTAIQKISNTLVPMIFGSIWNKNLTAFIGPSLQNPTSDASYLYAELRPLASNSASSSGSQTLYELKGKALPSHIVTYAISPAKDKVFYLVNENGRGIGYTSTLDGKTVTQIFNTPVVEVNAEWPEANTITLTTKGSALEGGYLYFVNPKTGTWKKVLGPVLGLSTRTSHDAKYVLASSADGSSVTTAILTVSSAKLADAVVNTLADKCVWGNQDMVIVYCAVPAQQVNGVYPDDWYRGTLTTADKIWQIDASSGQLHLISSIVDQSDRIIDAFNLMLDPKDQYLFFMNKSDLSFWSLDLVAGN